MAAAFFQHQAIVFHVPPMQSFEACRAGLPDLDVFRKPIEARGFPHGYLDIVARPCGRALFIFGQGSIASGGSDVQRFLVFLVLVGMVGGVGAAAALGTESPVMVALAAGSVNDEGHSLALKSDGTVWAWGSGICGQLGDDWTHAVEEDGSYEYESNYPIKVEGLPTIVAIAAGSDHSLCSTRTVTSGLGEVMNLGNWETASSVGPLVNSVPLLGRLWIQRERASFLGSQASRPVTGIVSRSTRMVASGHGGTRPVDGWGTGTTCTRTVYIRPRK